MIFKNYLLCTLLPKLVENLLHQEGAECGMQSRGSKTRQARGRQENVTERPELNGPVPAVE